MNICAMKHIAIVCLLFSFLSINGQKAVNSDSELKGIKGAQFEFDKTFVELGEVKKGEKRTFDYTLTNKGDEPIELEFITYCECTTVDYPEGKVLKKGQSMKFDVVFDSATKDEEETIEIEMELKNIDPKTGLRYYLTLDYHFKIVK